MEPVSTNGCGKGLDFDQFWVGGWVAGGGRVQQVGADFRIGDSRVLRIGPEDGRRLTAI